MAGIYNDKKEFEKSIEACSAALKIKPDFPDAYNNMAIAYFNSGDRAAAVEFMEKAAGLDPADERVRKNLEAMKAQVKQ
jgi:Flp pilus assembly protein TadD